MNLAVIVAQSRLGVPVKIVLSLPLPPSANRLWRTGRGKIYRSDIYNSWLGEVVWIIVRQSQSKRVTGSYKLTILATPPDKRKRDLDNLLKAASDALVKSGIIDGDHLCRWIEAKWVDGDPGCQLIVEEI